MQQIIAGDVDMIVNTPWGVGPRVDGYEIRTAAVMRGVPCMTTVQGLAACVQGIEALQRGEISVRSLQEHAAILEPSRRRDAHAGRPVNRRPIASKEPSPCPSR